MAGTSISTLLTAASRHTQHVHSAERTKNFSGAEIEGLVKSAASFALNRQVDVNDLTKKVDEDNIKVLRTALHVSLLLVAAIREEIWLRHGIDRSLQTNLYSAFPSAQGLYQCQTNPQ